jgi:hypothetical protein
MLTLVWVTICLLQQRSNYSEKNHPSSLSLSLSPLFTLLVCVPKPKTTHKVPPLFCSLSGYWRLLQDTSFLFCFVYFFIFIFSLWLHGSCFVPKKLCKLKDRITEQWYGWIDFEYFLSISSHMDFSIIFLFWFSIWGSNVWRIGTWKISSSAICVWFGLPFWSLSLLVPLFAYSVKLFMTLLKKVEIFLCYLLFISSLW